MWTHAILEIYSKRDDDTWRCYSHDDDWPTEGTPADWIEHGLVGYCDGELEDLIVMTPLLDIIKYKVKYCVEEAREYLSFRMTFDRCRDCGKPLFVFGEWVGNHDDCDDPTGMLHLFTSIEKRV